MVHFHIGIFTLVPKAKESIFFKKKNHIYVVEAEGETRL